MSPLTDTNVSDRTRLLLKDTKFKVFTKNKTHASKNHTQFKIK